MTPDLLNSNPRELKLRNELATIHKDLHEKGLEAEDLAVFIIGSGEMIIGECVKPGDGGSIADRIMSVKNPKRYLRIQVMKPDSMSVNQIIFDLDALEYGGKIDVKAPAAYWVRDQSVEGQITICAILMGYFQQKVMSRAAAAGIIAPNQGLKGR